jgi:hypothetical protein
MDGSATQSSTVDDCTFRAPQVQHPAAKLLVLAATMQEKECGDGTNFVSWAFLHG